MIKDIHIINNWSNCKTLASYIGQSYSGRTDFNFDIVPTNKAKVYLEDGKITRICTYSGLNWTAKYGYGSPTCDTDNYKN